MKPRQSLLDAQEGARILGVAPSTIRSWIHRGYLPKGTYSGGVLRWTLTQLQRAQTTAAAGEQPAIQPTNRAVCSCGTAADVTGSPEWVTLRCPNCAATIAVEVDSLISATRTHEPLNLADTAIDPEEIGAPYRLRALDLYLRHHVKGPQVYFIRMGPYVKIGTSVNVPARITSLSLSMSHLLATIDGDQKTEKATHQKYAPMRAFGEWFYLRDDLLDFCIARQREQIAIVVNALPVSA